MNQYYENKLLGKEQTKEYEKLKIKCIAYINLNLHPMFFYIIMSIAQFVSRGKRSFSSIFRFSDSVQKYKNSYNGKYEKKMHLGQIIIVNYF